MGTNDMAYHQQRDQQHDYSYRAIDKNAIASIACLRSCLLAKDGGRLASKPSGSLSG